MALEFRAVEPDEIHDLVRAAAAAFGASGDGAGVRAWADALEGDRSVAAFDGSRLVGASSTFTLELTVPGGSSIPVGGLTTVGVLPTHRRRGILRELMARHLDETAGRNEVAGALTASESGIYERFGYGIATWRACFEIETSRAAFRTPYKDPGSVELVDRSGALEILPDLHERIRLATPGTASRSAAMWKGILAQLDEEADQAVFHAIHHDADSTPDGYALYSHSHVNSAGALPTTRVNFLLDAVDAGARIALWRFLLDIDLIDRVSTARAPVDDPVRWVLEDPRQLRTTQIVDDLWLRILDIPAALRARTYATDGRLVLDVHDTLRPDTGGRFLLESRSAGVRCTPTDEVADVSLDVSTLSSLWLGAASFSRLRQAGRVQGDGEAVGRADALFCTPVGPYNAADF